MSRVIWTAAGAVAAVAVAVFLITRPGETPVAAVKPLAAESGPALARLGDQQVTADELKALLDQLPEPVREQLRNDRPALEIWIRARLAEKALYQQAQAEGWSERPDVQEQIRLASEQIVLNSYLNSVSQAPADYPSEQELEQAYEAEKAALQVPEMYRLSQIFLAVTPDKPAGDVLAQAQALSKQAQAAGAEFAELARKHSQDAGSAAQGGDIGLQPLAQLLPEVRGVVPQLKVGEVSLPVQSAQGFHILKLTQSQPSRVATLDEVREQLRNVLRAKRQEQAAKAHVEGMFNNLTLSIEGAELNKVLGAQP